MRTRFDEQLEQLNMLLIDMGALCEEAINYAVGALNEGSEKMRKLTYETDKHIDDREREIENLCLKLLLQQQPVARDLRQISSALKMISDMERIGDQAEDIAEITKSIKKPKEEICGDHISDMTKTAISMVTESVDSFVKKDLEIARAVIKKDDIVDQLFLEIKDDIISAVREDKTPGEYFVDILMIAKYLERRMGLRYDPLHEVLVTVGGSEAIDMCIRTLVQPGDEVIIPEPCFVCYEPITTLSGGVPVHVACRQEDEFRLRADALKAAITPKTKLLIMPFPNNPTGAVMEREDLEAVAEVLRGTNIMVLSDEIYAELNYGLRPHVSIATLPGMAERTIVVNGFSKTYAMTGWRLGYACGPAPIIRIMTKIHQSAIMSAPTTSQYAAITALKECDGEIDRMRDEYNMRRRLVVKSFNDMGLTCFEPRGAFYAFPCIKSTGMSSQDFCTKLLEQKHVAIIPGDAFGASGEGYARISYAYSVEHLKDALKRIREFLQENGIYHGI